MCGIAGILAPGQPRGYPLAAIEAMTDALTHRGPDASGQWQDAEAGLALGHRRLSIIDLTPAGAQPMTSADGRYVIAYNGEIYNTEEMRSALPAGTAWRGRSDTEVLLEHAACHGVRAAIGAANGMFALAIWDRRRRVLTLARDRLGIKPLYLARAGGAILLASELKAIARHPGFAREIDRSAVAAYLRLNYIPSPLTIWRDAEKLEPGALVEISADGEVRRERYWDTCAEWARAAHSLPQLDPREAEEELDRLVADSVRRQMISDVPLGAFLSGGIDSSLVVAQMQRASSRPVRTFTVGFTEPSFDEAPHAAAVAARLGSDHAELVVAPEDARAVIPRLPEVYDEPFADSSAIPTFLVSRLAREHVTVALSGDGGDELFAGYHRHAWAETLWRRLGAVPRLPRRIAGQAIEMAAAALGAAVPPEPSPVGHPGLASRMARLGDALGQDSRTALFRRLVTVWPRPEAVVLGAREPKGLLFDETLEARVPSLLDQAQLADLVTYLPDDILTKVDRASMAVSLEVRVPLLDHRLVAFAAGLQPGLRIDRARAIGDGGKVLLKRVLARHLPADLWQRPKQGFGIPVGAWLRGPLRAWCEELLAPERLARDGLIDAHIVRKVWAAHAAGRADHTTALWTILMLQAWREAWG